MKLKTSSVFNLTTNKRIDFCNVFFFTYLLIIIYIHNNNNNFEF